MGILPLESGNLANVNKFISQVGDFSMALSSKISAGGSISEEEYASMENLEQYAKKLKEGGWTASSRTLTPGRWTPASSRQRTIYGLPLVDLRRPPSPTTSASRSQSSGGAERVPQGNAQNNAASFLGVTQDKLTHTQDCAAARPTL